MINDFFDLKNSGTDAAREITAGVTTFLSAMYIAVVNPAILCAAGMPPAAVLTATVVLTALCSIGMGLYSNNPLLVAPGLGLNTLFVASVVHSGQMNWQTALGCVSYSGLLILVLLIADRKKRLLASVPHSLRFGFAGGIGLFIALIGLESARFIVPHQHMGASMGPLNAQTLTFLAGMAITSVLVVRKIAGAFIFGVLLTTLMAVPLGRLWGDASSPAVIYSGWLAMPDWSLVGRIDLSAALKPGCWPFILILAFSCLFDSLGTCVGVSEAGNLVDQNGDPVNLDQSLKANAAGLVLSGLMGSSPTTVFIESSTGVREGGRTGLTAVTAGLLFLPLLFFSPLLSLVPSVATAPMLVLAGVFMLKPLIYVRWERFDEAAPFFMSMILMPLTHSITQGIIWGVLSWTLLKAAGGQFRRISPVLLGLNAAALWLLINLKHLGY